LTDPRAPLPANASAPAHSAAAQPERSPGRPDRIAYLDALRGLAALSVATFFHYQHFSSLAQPGGPPPDRAPLYGFPPVRMEYQYGGFAVDFFFILSGVVFSHVYSQDIAEGRTAWKKFWALRLARLYPIHVATLLLVASLAWVFHSYTGRFPIYGKNGVFDFLLSLVLLQGGILDRGLSYNGPEWTLSVEVLLYGVFFVIARHRLTLPAAIAMLATGVAILASPVGFVFLANVPVARGLVGFALGIIVYLTAVAGDRPGLSIGGLSLFAGLMFALTAIGGFHKLGFCVVSSLLAAGLVVISRWRLPQRLLEVKPLTILGDASLSVYMLHVPIQMLILLAAALVGRAVPYESFAFWLGYVAIVLAAALPVHWWYERPMRLFLRRHLGHAPSGRSGTPG
jgi:peptidoglycan/LPS O-acetylase OafA/YrhL